MTKTTQLLKLLESERLARWKAEFVAKEKSLTLCVGRSGEGILTLDEQIQLDKARGESCL